MADPDSDDDLRRTREALANVLTPGECCTRETNPLRNQIVNLLRCEACQDMSFRVGNVHISGSLFRAVAYALEDPGHTLHIRIDPRLEKFAGKYDSGRFTFRFDQIRGEVQEMASTCETIIHECTHACVAMMGKTVLRTDNEVAAWFAGVLFLRGQGLPIGGQLDFRKNLRALADDARKANVKKKIYDVPPAAVAALRKDILQVYGMAPDMVDKGDAGF